MSEPRRPGRPRTYQGKGAPHLHLRIDPAVLAYVHQQDDPRAYVEQLVRDDANERAIRNGQEPPFPPQDLPG